MKLNTLLFAFLFTFLSFSNQAQTNSNSAEIISYQKFGEGLMVTRGKIAPISGTVNNFFFYNRADEPWNGNIWYEYDWEIRGKYPYNGWSQIRVRSEDGGNLKNAPVNVGTNENLGYNLYNYILIRKDDQYIYDIREDFDVSSYDYTNASAHGGNSASILTAGPRIYTTGGNVADIPTWKQLDFSLGITAFDNGWAGSLPDGSYSGDFVVDYTRFYQFSGNNLNTSPQWQDEFNNNYLDYSKWQVANWTYGVTQFSQNNLRFENGFLIMRVERDEDNEASTSTNNLALNGVASQSTTSHGGSADRAIDNNTNGNWGGKSITHTNPSNQTNAWWEVELSQDSEIDQIQIFNRTNCCSDRLSNFSVSVLDDSNNVVWTQYYTNTPSPSLTINLDALGKKVRVNLNGILSLAEVKVFGTPIGDYNLALDGSASQSSTGWNGIANRAIDNNTNGSYSGGSVTHTNSQNNAWWEVELAQNSEINEIVLHNRTDNCCTSRLSDFTVSVLNENGSTVWSQFYSSLPSSSLTINQNVTGRTVRVSLDGTLSLAEVQVFGTSTGNNGNLQRQEATSYFSAHKENGKTVGLTWRIDQESTADQYEIEYMNATGVFEQIGFVAGNTNDIVYNFLHENPESGKNTYRIKAIYADYSIIYLDPETVTFEDSSASKVFPNPNNGQLYVNLSEYLNQKVSLTLTDQSGKVHVVNSLDANHNSTVYLDMTKFENGFYMLHIKADNHKAEVEKISLMRTY